MKQALAFDHVTIIYPNRHRAISEVSFTIEAGECVALVGESGCGKTTMARAALGLLPVGTKVSGSIRVGETEVVGAGAATLRSLRGRVAGFVAQDPFAACNPLARVYDHVAEAWRVHGLRPSSQVIIDSLAALGIEQPETRARQYPHQWSGGMLQRAVIAAAAAHHPPLIIADEPTSALDADRADVTLAALRQSFEGSGAAMLLITHDLRLAARYADRIAVCQAGIIVEINQAFIVMNEPRHAYTAALLSAAPSAGSLIPKSFVAASGDADVVAEVRQAGKVYDRSGHPIQAIVNASLRVRRGEVVGIHGPSGCGKSTLLRLLTGIEKPTTGEIRLGCMGASSVQSGRSGFVMPIFQDPVSSLDRRWPVWRTLTEPLLARHRRPRPFYFARAERKKIAIAWLAEVGLANIDTEARPEELSVGQCQRVAIARALIAEPALIVADEPTSALDVSTAGGILRLLAAAADKGTGIVIVSHAKAVLGALCHRVLEMRDGVLED